VLSEVSHVIKGENIIIASQNVCWEEKGAFTGEISPVMLKDAGATAALIGHSERRQIFGEDDAMINQRIKGALKFGLMPVFCVGETQEERESGNTFSVLEKQIRGGLDGLGSEDMKDLVIAYEPVWAIGTGLTATDEQAQEAHAFIRNLITELFEKGVAGQLRILYGGSVKPDNVDGLMAKTDIDGALVGGAALDAESFGRIINFR
jgi:triosephosphate isomerase